MVPHLLLTISLLYGSISGVRGIDAGSDSTASSDAAVPAMNHSPTTGPGMEGDMGGMEMYFHGGTDETILFRRWMVMSWQELLGSCIGLALVAIAYEALKFARQVVYSRLMAEPSKTQKLRESYQMGYSAYGAFDNADTNSQLSDATLVDMGEQPFDEGCQPRHPICSGWHWLQVFLYMAQTFIGYSLMLAVMTYNAYVVVAVILGAGIGHVVFGWMPTKDSTDQLHCN